MYSAIVFLPLLGAIIAGIIAIFGAAQRHPGGEPEVGRMRTRMAATLAATLPRPRIAQSTTTHHEPHGTTISRPRRARARRS